MSYLHEMVHSFERKYLNEDLYPVKPSTVNYVLTVLSTYNFTLDKSIKHDNPMRNYEGEVHIQVIDEGSHVETDAEFRNFVEDVIVPLSDDLDAITDKTGSPITYSFGVNNQNQVTAGIDIRLTNKRDTIEIE